MKKILVLIVSLAAFVLLPNGHSAHAQATITLERMVIEIWPEFDQREALVLYSGQVTSDTTAPVTLSITLPPTAELNAVAYRAPQGLLQADYTVEGDTVVMTSPTGLFHIEYYDAAFAYDAQERSYNLVYAADYAINELVWSVQQPPDSGAITVDPEPAVSNVNNAGLTVVEGTQQGLQPGDPFSLSFDYTRSSDTLVLELLNPQQGAQPAGAESVAPQGQTPAAGGDGLSTGAIIAIALGVGLVVGAGIYMVYMGGPQAALASLGVGGGGRSSRGRSRRDKPLTSSSRNTGQPTMFCGQCGERVSADDKFCRHCGAAT